MVEHCKCLWFHPTKIDCFCSTYGVSPQSIRLIETYYEGIFSKSFSESATSAWHRHQWGIFEGCTFLDGMNIILEYSMHALVPKFTTNNTTLPLLRTFMDGLSLIANKVSGAQTLLSRCITLLFWCLIQWIIHTYLMKITSRSPMMMSF